MKTLLNHLFPKQKTETTPVSNPNGASNELGNLLSEYIQQYTKKAEQLTKAEQEMEKMQDEIKELKKENKKKASQLKEATDQYDQLTSRINKLEAIETVWKESLQHMAVSTPSYNEESEEEAVLTEDDLLPYEEEEGIVPDWSS